MPKPCKKSASTKDNKALSMDDRYAIADLKEQIKTLKKKVKKSPERDERIQALNQEILAIRKSGNKTKKPAKMSLAEFDAMQASSDKQEVSSSSEDSD